MTHHVVQHAATLQLTAPEPRHVWSAVLLRGTGEVWPTRGCRPPRPRERATRGHVRRKKLILQIAVFQTNAVDELQYLPRFDDVAREWLLTRDALELSLAALDRVDD